MRSTRVAALAVACALLTAGCAGNGDSGYQRDNNRLLDSVPVYPGATERHREDAVRTEDERDAGWTARAEYGLATPATAEQVLAFYRGALVGWTPDETCCAGLPTAVFHRGTEQVSVNADNAPGRYEVTVDAHAS